jgi:hypothetical protein
MQKWEHCCVGPIKESSGWKGHYPRLFFFETDGLEVESIRASGGSTEEDVLAATIARLGEEGWEMVGCGALGGASQGNNMHYLYFKRPQP